MTSTEQMRRPKACLASGAGGHLTQVLKMKELLPDVATYIITHKNPHLENLDAGCNVWYVERVLRNPIRLLVNFLQSVRIFVREKPDLVLTAGSGEAVPTFIVARCLGRRTVFVESFSRVRTPSWTGKFLRNFADIVLVQWEPLLSQYPGSRFAGAVFAQRPSSPLSGSVRLLLTVGTQTRGFDRLVQCVDAFLSSSPGRMEAIAQIGTSAYEPRHMKSFRFLPPHEFARLVEWADVVVTHSGAGLIGQALELGKRVVVVPRDARRGETLWTHDAELPTELSKLGVVRLTSVEDLPETLRHLREWTPRILPSGRFKEEIARALTT